MNAQRAVDRSLARLQAVLEDPATPYWVRDLIAPVLRGDRDPVDALNHLEGVAQVLRSYVEALYRATA